MYKFSISVITALLILCGAAFPVPVTTSSFIAGYTFTTSVDTFDATNDCATRNCLKDVLGNAPTQGFKQVEMSKVGLDVYGLSWDGYIYHLNTAPLSQNPPLPAVWEQMTALGHTNINAIAVKDSATIFALGGLSGCSNGAHTVMKANATLNGWNNTSPVHCSTSIAVAVDGTLASIDSSTGLFTYRLPGVTAWTQAVGTGFTQSATAVSSSIAYGIKYTGISGTSVIYQFNLTTGQSAPIAVNVPSGSFVTIPWNVTADASNNLWITTTQGQLWHQGRATTLALGATGPVWNGFSGHSNTTSITGTSQFNFVLSGTVISHLNVTGFSLSVQGSGAYPTCPFGVSCNFATHTLTVTTKFMTGGYHAGWGVSNQSQGTVLAALYATALESTTDCDPFSPDSGCQIAESSSVVNCVAMGLVASDLGFINHFINPAFTRYQGNSKSCVLDPRSGKNVCSYNVTSWCTAATTPPTMDTNILLNEEDSAGFPVFFDAWGVCVNAGFPGEPWSCRGLTSLPTRINSFPRAVCTVLPIP